MTYKFIQLDYLDTISSGDSQLRQTLLEMVFKELKDAFPEMTKAHQEQNWEGFHEIVHKLKSTLAYVGNSQLIRANHLMLSELEDKNYQADFGIHLGIFQQLSDPVLNELKKELDGWPAS